MEGPKVGQVSNAIFFSLFSNAYQAPWCSYSCQSCTRDWGSCPGMLNGPILWDGCRPVGWTSATPFLKPFVLRVATVYLPLSFSFSFFCLCFLSDCPPFPSLTLILYYPFVPFLLTPPLASLPELAGLKQSLHPRHTEATSFIGKRTARLPTSDVGMFRGLPSQWLIHPG